MQEGLLWLDADKKRDLAEKVARAAARYQEKFGQPPNLCYVHTSALNGQGSVELDGVRLVPAENVLKHHFWIGIEENGKALKAEEPPRAGGKRYVCKQCGAEPLDTTAAACWACGYDGKEAA